MLYMKLFIRDKWESTVNKKGFCQRLDAVHPKQTYKENIIVTLFKGNEDMK